MAETITIPSPSAFLSSSPILRALPSPPTQRRRSQGGRSVASSAAASQKQKAAAGVGAAVKPKQSKSRNGCITCKAKRLKCDETHPSCQQCHKRSVTCGGYKKDFKWRPFEETSLNSKIFSQPRQKKNSIPSAEPPEIPLATSPTNSNASSTPLDIEPDPLFTSPPESYPKIEDIQDQYDFTSGNPYSESSFSSPPTFFDIPSDMEELGKLRLFSEPGFTTTTGLLSNMFDEISMAQQGSRTSFSGQSPRLIDLLLPGSELDTTTSNSELMQDLPPMSDSFEGTEEVDKIEDIPREHHFPEDEPWNMELVFGNFSPATSYRNDFSAPLYRQPEIQAGSPEMLMLRFDKQTCGILSIKDGPTENPWRTLIWPLARDSPALYHAIASMTAFHTSKGEPNLRVDGMEHMRRSIRLLSYGLSEMRPDTALATTLALAFSESWDQHISTGIKHLRGAKILVNQALIQHNKRSLAGDDLARLKFLCNTFIYMDVIARLTSVDADESNDFESFISPLPTPFGSLASSEIDPLMGCASTLFPLIGRAANLCRRARHSQSNSIAIISQAMELKEQMEQWESGTSFETPEDPSSEVKHALQTAEAYRYATLLYLHQAVPEIPSLTSAQLAKKVLVYLATVPLSSRLVIVQIYPLLAAGCEATEEEDRQWVRDRWQYMSARMWIGNIDRCCEVVMEVWQRRDAFVARKEALRRGKQSQRNSRSFGMPLNDSSGVIGEISKEMSEAFSFQDMLNSHSGIGRGVLENRLHGVSSLNGRSDGESRLGLGISGSGQRKRNSEAITEDMDVEYTVRGQLHWVGVMKDWGWEVLLG